MIPWIRNNRTEVIVIFLLILVTLFLRFYRMPEYMTFLGDEGRDALVIKRILVDHDFPLLGPPTSVGNIYLGPLYYYMMALPMLVFWLNPISTAAMVAVIGTLSVCLIYYLSRSWFGKTSALISAILYSISPVNIIYSRSSWNPNPAPFFTLLTILGFYLAHQRKNYYWLIISGGSLAFALQMHYLALILVPIFILLWLYELFFQKRRFMYRHFLAGSLVALFVFLILMSPLLIFDLKYNFMNLHAISAFFTQRETTVNLNLISSISRTLPIYSDKLIGRYLGVGNQLISIMASIIIILPLVINFGQNLWNKKVLNTKWPYLVLGVWLLVGLLGLSLYKQNIYDHYLGFLNPAPFLLLGAVTLLFKRTWQKIIFGFFIVMLFFLNLQKNPLLLPPNNQLTKTQEIAKFVILKAEDKPFNFALIAQHNYDAAYQFYLGIYGHKPKVVPYEITDQLFVVCEDEVCNPVVNPKYEIAGFGMTKIEAIYSLYGVKIFKLIVNPGGQSSFPLYLYNRERQNG